MTTAARVLRRLVADEPGSLERLTWLIALPAALAIAWRVFVPSRPDYLGHYLAGFGGTLSLAWALARLTGRRRGAVLAAVVACVALGWAAEHTLFRIAAFDPLDFHAQSLGAVLAGLAVLHARAEDGLGTWVAAVSAASLVGGFVMAFS